MAQIDTILFDFDGTIMNTNNVIINSWQHTFKTIEGSERSEEEIVKTFGEPLETTMKKFFPHMDVKDSIGVYRSYHYKNFGELISLFPGVRELLEALKNKYYKVGLVTSRLKKTTNEGLEKYQIKEFFDTVVTCEDVTKHKPDPEPILVTLDKLNSGPEQSIMLGDSMFDILCAKNAGVRSVLVSWAVAVGQDEINGPDGPDYVLDRAEDLFKII